MRQVMPHRNNIVSDGRSCKTFLHPDTQSPANPPRCCNLVPFGKCRVVVE
jgi:hypothetical protein